MQLAQRNNAISDCAFTKGNAIKKVTIHRRRRGRPLAPVAEGGPVGFPTGGTDGTGSLGVRGLGWLRRRVEIVTLFIVFLLVLADIIPGKGPEDSQKQEYIESEQDADVEQCILERL